MKYKITHKTHYNYHEMVNLAHNESWLVPISSPFQNCIQTHISIEPKPAIFYEYTDFFGNKVSHFSIQQPHSQMNVIAVHHVEVNRYHFPNCPNDPTPWEDVRELLTTSFIENDLYARQFVLGSPTLPIFPEVRAYTLQSFWEKRPLLEATQDLMRRIHSDFKFVSGATTISTPLLQVFEQRKGVCQDFAHIGIACLRSIGLAALYVSGFIETIPPEGKKKMVGSDASHAWFAVYSPTFGWIDFDPTNNQLANDQYITVAHGRDYADVTPLKGVIFSSGRHQLHVSVDVVRVGY